MTTTPHGAPTPPRTLSSGELATALNVHHNSVLRWAKEGRITPALTTPGGHHRWVEADVRAEIKAGAA